jgi:hypothetical protein
LVDVRVVQVGRSLSLGPEAFDVARPGQLAFQDHLQRDGSVQADLPGLVDYAHAAPSNLFQQLVVAEVADARGLNRPVLNRLV